jgi:hypothetical protein
MEYMEENSNKIWTIWNKGWKKDKLNSEIIWKIWKKMGKRFGKYRIKLRSDMDNMEERQVE